MSAAADILRGRSALGSRASSSLKPRALSNSSLPAFHRRLQASDALNVRIWSLVPGRGSVYASQTSYDRSLTRKQIRFGQVDYLVATTVHHRAQEPQAETSDFLRRDRRGHGELLLGGHDIQQRRPIVV